MLLAALTTFFTLCISQTSADTVLGTGRLFCLSVDSPARHLRDIVTEGVDVLSTLQLDISVQNRCLFNLIK